MRAVEDRGFNRGLVASHLTRLAGALAALATTAAHAQMSTPILNPATGNYYAYVTAPGAGITWQAAADEAQTVRRDNVPGHLAVPTSLAENTWIVENMLIMGVPGFPSGYPVAADRYWLGGYQMPGSNEPADGWTWVTGEPFVFANANWDPIEPNNSGGEERLAYWRRNHTQPYDPLDGTQRPVGEWNDEPSWLQNKGYVVEWETPVPWNTAGQFNYGYADANRADPGPGGPVASYAMKWFDLRPGFSFGLGVHETLTLDSNNGTLIIGAGSTFTANGTLWNKTVENAHLFRMPANNMRYWTRTQGGVVHALPPGQAVLIDPNNIVDLNVNTLGYVGAGAGFAHTNGGIAAPGVNPMNSLLDSGRITNHGVFAWDGRMFITGRYIQSPTGTTRIYIAGANEGTQYSRLNVQGRADLEGSLQVILEPSLFNYVPDVGATFDVINSDTALTLPFAGLNVTTLMTVAGAQSLGLNLPAHNSGFTADPNQLVELPSNLFTVSTVNGGLTLRLTLTSPLCVPITGPTSAEMCAGAPANFSIVAKGSGPKTYQWRKNGVNIPGATSTSYAIPTTNANDSGNYDCVVTSGCGAEPSPAATLAVNSAPIVPAPSNVAACVGGPASFTVTPTGGGTFTYQWRKGGIDIGGATGATLNIPAVVPGDVGNYDCVVTNSCGNTTSGAASLIINDAASVASSPSNQAVCANAPASFSVTASGTAPFTYQWRKGGVDIGGATSSTLSFANAIEANEGSYDCVVTNACGSATSAAATLTVNDAATVASNPSNQTVCVDAPASFTVTASGTASFTYQWRKGGVDIGGATSSTLSFGAATLADVGSYDCVITNACGSVTSTAATLTVNEIATVASNPSNQTVCVDAPASFTVTASGTAPFTYQWRKGGVDIVGATSPTLTLTSSSSTDAGSYDCVITNACGSATSTTATLTVNETATVASNPSNQTVCANAPASFSVTASGTAPFTYQWRKGGVDIGGATSSTLSFATALEADEGSYDCVITNECGSATSTAATLTVNDAATIASAPSNQTVCNGAPASFIVTASGTAPFTYQWRKGGVDIGGATSSTLAFAAVTPDDIASYDCVVTNACGSATSAAASLEVDSPASIASNPSNQDVCSAQPASFTVVAGGTPPYSYQWRKGGVDIGGATSSTLSFATVLEADEGSYDCVITNACGSATSAVATLTVNDAATVASSPSNQTVCADATASFSVTAAGTAPFTYQWRKGGVDISGATSSTLSFAAAIEADEGTYDCVVTNACGSATSSAATLTVNDAATVASNPSNQTVCADAPASFTVVASGTAPFTYQWRKGGVDIGGATSSTLSFATALEADEGTYDCVITNACGSATTTPVTLTVNDAATVASNPSNQAACLGAPASFSVTAAGTAPFTYQWRKDGVDIVGATTSTLSFAATILDDVASYDCVITNACGSATSAAATLAVNEPATVASNPSNQTVCDGAPASFSVSANGTAPFTYQWRKGGVDIVGATSPTLTLTPSSSTDAGSYDCVITNACGSATSTAATLTVDSAATIASSPSNQAVCSASPASFTVTANGTAPFTYQWRKGGVDIGGATLSTYTIASTLEADAGSYDCVVTNACGSATSAAATLTVNASASIASSPSNQTVCVDAPVSFSVTANGTAPITYQWRKGGVDIGGATSSTLSFASALEADAGVYDCVVTNACGSATSGAATLAVQNSPSIGTQPDSLAIPAGSQAVFTVAATGSAPITYQWRKDETPLVDGGTITGATTASLTINLVSTSDIGDYDCVVTNPCGSVNSSVAVLHISGCPADIDDGTGTGTPDDGVDINDLLYFLQAFQEGSTNADLDDGNNAGTPDGGVDINDLLFFLAHFESGC